MPTKAFFQFTISGWNDTAGVVRGQSYVQRENGAFVGQVCEYVDCQAVQRPKNGDDRGWASHIADRKHKGLKPGHCAAFSMGNSGPKRSCITTPDHDRRPRIRAPQPRLVGLVEDAPDLPDTHSTRQNEGNSFCVVASSAFCRQKYRPAH